MDNPDESLETGPAEGEDAGEPIPAPDDHGNPPDDDGWVEA
ncbi:hypothetical protein SMD20_44670 [Nonomuraea sp. LP-02]|nr:hypothetical protein [Nonomuraea sp. LP-02]MED7931380.1 hypothetical protein [Nonomuraea sp. LP-02]